MNKWDRNYELKVQLSDGSFLTIRLPFTIDFNIERSTLYSSNTSTIRIFNLNDQHRNQIRFNFNSSFIYRQLILRAGYGDNLAVIFQGNINYAYSYREGADYITEIQGFDGGFAISTGFYSANQPQGLSYKQIISSMIQSLPFIQVGAVGNVPNQAIRSPSLFGNTCDLINQLSGNYFFIDNEKGYVLGTNEVLVLGKRDFIPVISSQSGILNTPRLELTNIDIEILFDPQFYPGQRIKVFSSAEPLINGDYKIVGFAHQGTISASVSGNLTTTLRGTSVGSLIDVFGV